MKRRNTILFFFLWILITISAVVPLRVNTIYNQKGILHISHDSGIYDESLVVTVDLYMPGTIYYTVDGENPQPDEDGILPQDAMVYESPLYLELLEDTTVYSFQFYCLLDDGTASEIYKRDYILDPRGTGRFSTTYVVSVTGDEEKLFGYEEGLFVRGRQFDEYMAQNPEVDLLNTVIPANYFSDTEVPVNVAIFHQDGAEILSQNCGLKIYGNVTRAKNQKSFRLIARYDYDTVNEFSYAFFPKLISEEKNTAIDAFQRLSFHNSGNDNGYGFIRTELIGELARKSGFSDVLVSESATVFVNGRYQGVYWLENTFDDKYFKEKYGSYDGEMVVCEGMLNQMSVENAETEAEVQFSEEYNSLCKWALTADMSNEADWNYVCSMIDIENFARYMAIEYYINNMDWPYNNVKVYRYQCAEGEEYRDGTVFDGRYRYLLFDTDYGLGLQFLGWVGLIVTDKRLEFLSADEDLTGLFHCLLNREDFRILFIHSVMDLMDGSFSKEEVSSTYYEYNRKRYDELRYMIEETTLLKNSLWEPDDNGMEHLDIELAKILDFAERRPAVVLEELQEKWNCGNPVRLSISSEGTGNISIGGLRTNTSTYEGLCLSNVSLEIAVEPIMGVTVTGFYVNSVFVEGNKINLIPGEWIAGQNDTIFIEVAAEIEPVGNLMISAYHTRGTNDYVILQNNGSIPVNLSDYALSDSADELSKGQLPEMKLDPGEKYVVYGEKYSGKMEAGSMQVPFSWNSDEEIFLIHISQGIIDIKSPN